MTTIRCVVERITYQNDETGFSVLKARVKGYPDLVPLVGPLVDIACGTVLLCEGTWKVDTKYGQEFLVEKWEEVMPSTVYGMEKYLGSGLIKGIGPVFAKRIVAKFGLKTLDVLESQPDLLKTIEGIGESKLSLIKESYQNQKEIKNIMVFLQSHDVSPAFACKIFKSYGQESIQKVTENPYRLADDIWGIGFKTADTIAQKLGFDLHHPLRLRSGIFYTLSTLSDDGHVFAQKEQLQKKGAELLEVSPEELELIICAMVEAGDLILDEDAYYLPPFYYAELGVSRKLTLLHKVPSRLSFAKIDFDTLQKETGIIYDELQKTAIQTALDSKVMILTGGPGTGKTTTIKGIINQYQKLQLKILLAAPTGRAAKRMSETTGLPAKTIHRLLECQPQEGYRRNENNPLKGDVLIVDESSMIDLILMNALLKAVPKTMKVLFIGDVDQLPSVGAGNVLRDIIDSGCFPVIRLEKIWRQAQTSQIIMNAHRINHGEMPILQNSNSTDFFFIEEDNPEKGAEELTRLVTQRLPGYNGIHVEDIQVLTPMQKGSIGAITLNQVLQDAINPQDTALKRGGISFRVKDKVMQIHNNYEKEVFNGDIGVIREIHPDDREMIVVFDGRPVLYDQTELDELTLAYAITIHKSQGSEYPVVVLPLFMTHFVMLQRNLLYTGITRAKKLLVLLGSKKALHYATRNVVISKRNSNLQKRLLELAPQDLPQDEEPLTLLNCEETI